MARGGIHQAVWSAAGNRHPVALMCGPPTTNKQSPIPQTFAGKRGHPVSGERSREGTQGSGLLAAPPDLHKPLSTQHSSNTPVSFAPPRTSYPRLSSLQSSKTPHGGGICALNLGVESELSTKLSRCQLPDNTAIGRRRLAMVTSLHEDRPVLAPFCADD